MSELPGTALEEAGKQDGQMDEEKIDSEKAVATESRDCVVFVPEAGQGFFSGGRFCGLPSSHSTHRLKGFASGWHNENVCLCLCVWACACVNAH